MKLTPAYYLLLLCSLLFAGCSDYLPKHGEVARVNGRPIFLKSVQDFYDSNLMGLTGPNLAPSVEQLRKGYNQALSELIIIELVNQELEKRKISVTDAEVAQEEINLRADYPEGAFEQQALEDSLSLESWRLQLKGRLAVKRFMQKVLQPQITVTPEEFKEYYQSNNNTIPAQIHFRILQADDPKLLAKAASVSSATKMPENFQSEFPGVVVREGRLAKERIEKNILQQLSPLKEQQAGAVLREASGYICYVLIEKIPAKEVSFTDSFRINEEAILEEKLELAFKMWVETALSKAEIKIAPQLLTAQKENTTNTLEPPAQEPPSPEPGDTTNATNATNSTTPNQQQD